MIASQKYRIDRLRSFGPLVLANFEGAGGTNGEIAFNGDLAPELARLMGKDVLIKIEVPS